MNAKMKEIIQKGQTVWKERTMKQRALILGGVVTLIVAIVAVFILSSQVKYVPLYTGQTAESIGQIKAVLDEKGVPIKISSDGTSISVPEEQASDLLVELAEQGYPKTGDIGYSFFAENSGLSTTDNEFNMLKVATLQSSLEKMIEGIKGIENANVMITLPKESVFISDSNSESSVAVFLTLAMGHTFEQSQVNALYHLISKAIPNLPVTNIEIIDQYAQYYDMKTEEEINNTQVVANQMSIKKEIERDIRRQVQQMLGTMMGQDKVFVSVTTDIDFKQENRSENLVLPVDEENMEGLAISAERITENYTGSGAAGGVPAAETDGDVAGVGDYQVAQNATDNGTYESNEERINYDVSRIQKEIVEAPYKIRDLGIQVAIEPPDPDDRASLEDATVEEVRNILSTIIRTTVAKDTTGESLADDELNQRVSISVQKLNGKQVAATGFFERLGISPTVGIGILVVLLLLIGLLVFLLLRNRKKKEEEEAYIIEELSAISSDDDDEVHLAPVEATTSKKYLDKLAAERPAEFAKLIRTWMVDDN